jgi:hypothetical protein
MMQRSLSPTEVQQELTLSDEMMRWLAHIESPATSRDPVLPDDAEATQLMERLDVKLADRAATLAARLDPEAHPALWWILDRAYHDMLANMGCGEPAQRFGAWPALPASTGALGMHLYVWLFLAVLPEVRRFHAERGISDAVSWTSLAVLGRVMDSHRSMTGVSGLGLWSQWGLPLRFRGADYQLGRLSFNRGVVAFFYHSYAQVLHVHIPPLGSLDPAACDEAFALAREFFPRHFPDEPVSFFVCHSWLMDDQLAAYLPDSSNIVQFQHRFRLLQETDMPPADSVIVNYAFQMFTNDSEVPLQLLDELPQDTTLQRAFVAHLRSGGHWHNRTGWLPF